MSVIFLQTSAPDLTTIYKIYIVKKRWICVFLHLRKRSEIDISLSLALSLITKISLSSLLLPLYLSLYHSFPLSLPEYVFHWFRYILFIMKFDLALSILLTRPPCELNFMQLLKDLFVVLLMLPQTDFIVFGIDPVILGIHYKWWCVRSLCTTYLWIRWGATVKSSESLLEIVRDKSRRCILNH